MRSLLRFRQTLLIAAALVVGCRERPSETPPPSSSASFTIATREDGFDVSPTDDPSRILIGSYAGGTAAYSPLATRHATANWEMKYGAWRITDGPEPWTIARRLATPSSATAPFTWTNTAGAPIAEMRVTEPAPGSLLLTFRAVEPGMNRLSLAFACAPGDRFLGFGAQADALDHRGHKVPIWTSEPGIGKSTSDDPGELWMLEGARHASSLGLPTWLSQRGYIGVVESDRRSVFELCSAHSDAWRVETWGPELKLHLHYGPTPAQALERATAGVLGRPMRPPPLAFAPWNDAIYGAAKVREMARLIRERGIPSSALWTEDFRGAEDALTGYRLEEEWETDRTLYPEVEKLAADLRRDGFAWFAYFNTFLVTGTRIYDEARAGGHLVRAPGGGPYLFDGVTFVPSGLADLSRPATREWVKGYLRKALDDGFDGWMTDFGEWLPHDAVLDSGEDPLEAHNRYPAEWDRINAEVLAERAGDGRQRVFFARSGWLGSTAYVPVWWAGDQRTSFLPDDGMPTVVTMGINLGLAGISTYGHDIAGYQSATNPPSTKELFFRWTALGALSPVMRTHHGIDARRNWWFGEDEETIAHFKRWAEFHIRLFPYLDGASAVAEATGLPIMRALPLEFPDDAAGWGIHDQYLLGPGLLVAPVLEEGRTARRVHLPAGRWYPLAGGAAVDGPADLEVAAVVTEIPVYGRAGAIVPTLPKGVQTLLPAEPPVVDLDDVNDRRELLVFAGASGSFRERDGTSYTLEFRPDAAKDARFVVDGQAISACLNAEQRGCYDGVGGHVRVRMPAGASRLEFAGNALRIDGTRRQIDVVVRQ